MTWSVFKMFWNKKKGTFGKRYSQKICISDSGSRISNCFQQNPQSKFFSAKTSKYCPFLAKVDKRDFYEQFLRLREIYRHDHFPKQFLKEKRHFSIISKRLVSMILCQEISNFPWQKFVAEFFSCINIEYSISEFSAWGKPRRHTEREADLEAKSFPAKISKMCRFSQKIAKRDLYEWFFVGEKSTNMILFSKYFFEEKRTF